MDELAEFKRFLGSAAKEYNNSQLQQLRREMKAATESLATSFVASNSSQNGNGSGPKLAALRMATVAVQQQNSQPSALQALADQALVHLTSYQRDIVG